MVKKQEVMKNSTCIYTHWAFNSFKKKIQFTCDDALLSPLLNPLEGSTK